MTKITDGEISNSGKALTHCKLSIHFFCLSLNPPTTSFIQLNSSFYIDILTFKFAVFNLQISVLKL